MKGEIALTTKVSDFSNPKKGTAELAPKYVQQLLLNPFFEAQHFCNGVGWL